jgi:hypothetical protein
MTVRQQIVDAVVARLATILRDGGYNSDLGMNVFEWRDKPLKQADLPAVIVRDARNEPSSEAVLGTFGWALTIELDVLVAAGTVTAAQMRDILADIYAAIGTDYTWGSLVSITSQPTDEMRLTVEDHILSGAAVSFTVNYSVPRWNT